MKHLSFVLLLLFSPATLRAADGPGKLDEKAVDAILQKAMKQFGSPGLACVIVKDDEVIYLRGHGVRDIESKKPVTPDSLFGIASNSKAFTATAVGFLVAEGKMKWDDSVRKHLPSFRMNDELADREVTIRDLLCHRTGVIRHDIIWVANPTWSRDEMIRRSGQLKPDRSFRAVTGYNNFQFLTAGVAAGKAADTTWEQLVQKRIFDPLGMKGSNFDTRVAMNAKDLALPHLMHEDREPKATTPYNIDNMAPAGSINSNVRDLANWLRFQLGEGTFDGKRLLPPSVLAETHTPQSVIRVGPDQTAETRKMYDGVVTQFSYGLGWRVMDYRGKRMISHGGSLFGYRSDVTLFPDQKFGMAVLTNLADTSLPLAASHALADHLLGADPRDWNALFKDLDSKRRADEKKKDDERNAKRKPNTKASLPLSGYTGTFEEAAHGTVQIIPDGERLRFQYGVLTVPMEHYHFDTFVLTNLPERFRTMFGDRLVAFRLDAAGGVEGFTFLGQDFRKARTSKQ
jgi:CubicO group peptidase (beta-lactamase class C family)